MRILVAEMRRKGASLGVTCEEIAVVALEKNLRVPLPHDYRAFLREAGGVTPRGIWRGLWKIDEIASLNRVLPVFQWFGGLIGFGNEGFTVYAFDYRRGPLPSVVMLGLSSSDWDDVTQEAASFEEWVRGSL
ncbi:MAG: SMI1/KNR4 family protein [Pseudomonadota bacterium]